MAQKMLKEIGCWTLRLHSIQLFSFFPSGKRGAVHITLFDCIGRDESRLGKMSKTLHENRETSQNGFTEE